MENWKQTVKRKKKNQEFIPVGLRVEVSSTQECNLMSYVFATSRDRQDAKLTMAKLIRKYVRLPELLDVTGNPTLETRKLLRKPRKLCFTGIYDAIVTSCVKLFISLMSFMVKNCDTIKMHDR